jgi:hypothetical protein
MSKIYPFLILSVLAACIGPFAGKKSEPWLAGPPHLTGQFDSETATVRIQWPAAAERGFLRYEVQRQTDGAFHPFAEIADRLDTTYVDERLDANEIHRYRVVSFFGSGDSVHELASTTASGSDRARLYAHALSY